MGKEILVHKNAKKVHLTSPQCAPDSDMCIAAGLKKVDPFSLSCVEAQVLVSVQPSHIGSSQ